MHELHQQELLVRSFVDNVLNRAKLHLLDDYVDVDAIDYDAFIVSDIVESHNFRRDVERLLRAFSDLSVDIVQVVNSPHHVALRMSLSGRHTGSLPGISEPTLRMAQWNAMALLRVERGRISALHGVSDRLHMFRQLASDLSSIR